MDGAEEIPMIVSFLFVMVTAPTATQAAPTLDTLLPDRAARKVCPDLGPRIATVLRKGVRPQRLDRLPPGRLEYGVFRQVDGCPIPAVVREGVGR